MRELPGWSKEELSFLSKALERIELKNTKLYSCSGKQGFSTKKEADKICRRMSRYKNGTHGAICSFKCDACSQWHVGHRHSKRIRF